MTQRIPLKGGDFALVDDADYEVLNAHKWGKSNGYVSRGANYKSVYMHRLIMGASATQHVDHINNNTLDNRRCNLRLCSNSQNHANIPKRSTPTSSQYKGVSWDKRDKKWQAHIKCNYKSVCLGRYPNEADAARAYNEAAKKHFGEFANLNQVE